MHDHFINTGNHLFSLSSIETFFCAIREKFNAGKSRTQITTYLTDIYKLRLSAATELINYFEQITGESLK